MRITLINFLASFLACGFGMLSLAHAQGSERLDDIEQQLIEKAAEESRLKNEAEERENELKSLREQMISTASSLQDAEQKIGEINLEIDRLEGEEKTILVDLTSEQENLGDVLAALQSLERSKPPALLVSPDDANKAARIAMLLADAAPELEKKASALRQSLEQLVKVRTELDGERANQVKTNAEITSRRDVLAELFSRKENERDVAASLAAAAQRETAALAARATSLKGVLQRLERFARSITPRLKPAPSRPANPVTSRPPSRKPARIVKPFSPAKQFSSAEGTLQFPVSGQLFGKFRQRRPEGGRFEGIRFVTADNAIVTAPFQADVVFARAWDPIGNLIVLDVGQGYHILFMGVGAFLVEEGQEVSLGEPLGTMRGNNARLDLEIRKNGEPVNPELWLSSKSKADEAY